MFRSNISSVSLQPGTVACNMSAELGNPFLDQDFLKQCIKVTEARAFTFLCFGYYYNLIENLCTLFLPIIISVMLAFS